MPSVFAFASVYAQISLLPIGLLVWCLFGRKQEFILWLLMAYTMCVTPTPAVIFGGIAYAVLDAVYLAEDGLKREDISNELNAPSNA